jgi:hypothetical protein
VRTAWLLVVPVVLVGCFDPRPPSGVPCSVAAPCPSGQTCVNNMCNGEDPPGPPPGDGPRASDGPGVAECDNPIPLALASDTTGSLDGATDDIVRPTGCGTDGIEVIYATTVSSSMVIGFQVSSPDFTGKAYAAQMCPPTSFKTCTSISPGGGVAATTFQAGTVYLFVERNAGNGTTFTIKPQ